MLRNIIGVAVSAFFIVLIFHMLDFRATLNHLAGIRAVYIAPFVLCHLAGLFFRSFRWGLILRPSKPVRLGTLFPITVIGYMLSNILPLKLGEFARIFLLEQREEISKMTVAATLVLEKLVDAVLVTLIFLPIALSSPLPSWLKPVLVVASALIAGVSLLLLYAARADGQSFRLLRSALAGRAPRVHHFIERTYDRFLEGLGVLKVPGLLLKVLLSSLPIFLFGGLSAYWLIKALGLGWVPFQASFATFIFIYFSALIPSAPGGVGTLEYFAILALSLYAVPKELGLSFALSYHSLIILALIVLGLFF
ncbi:MAG: lysylphosphatidylglycerol synthase transmembrane domain-containing protein, partial [Nitrospinota bacterium]